jgi:amidase
LADLKLYCEAVVGGEPWLEDPRCLPIPWRKVVVKSKLKIGVLWNDGIVIPTPPVRRALKETVMKLQDAGHELVDWSPEGHMECLKLMVSIFSHREKLDSTYNRPTCL